MLIFCFFIFSLLSAQETEQLGSITIHAEDSILEAKQPELKGEERILVPIAVEHSVRRAWILSAFVPGAGQIYNKKYWKAPIVWAGLGTAVYFLQSNAKLSQLYEDAYFDYVKEQRNMPNDKSYKELQSLLDANVDWGNLSAQDADYIKRYLDNNRRNYKRNRDLTAIAVLGVYFLNIIDAAVDAHFFDFDVGEDLRVHWQPNIVQTSQFTAHYGFRCYINF